VDDKHSLRDLKSYVGAFSPNIQEIFQKFNFNDYIEKLDDKDLLLKVIKRYADAPIDPNSVSDSDMGNVYEELITKASEQEKEQAGDHFTPREVIKLMVNVLFSENTENLEKESIKKIYDPACGTGGMLSVSASHIAEKFSKIKIEQFGQELMDQTYAISKSSMILNGLDGDRIKQGNSLFDGNLNKKVPGDAYYGEEFHYMLSNPPFGVDWSDDEKEIKSEHEKGLKGKYPFLKLPRKSDGALLFLSHMVNKMKKPEDGGSRIAIIFNGSPLFTGEAESGESEIRKYLITNDLVETIIGLPDNLFYKTNILTYLWIVNNNKPEKRKGKIQLINAVSKFVKMKTSIGKKTKRITESQIEEITNIYKDFKKGKFCKIFDNDEFAYTRVTVERPLRRNFQASKERIELLKNESAFEKLNTPKKTKNDPSQNSVIKVLEDFGTKKYKNYDNFSKDLTAAFSASKIKLSTSLKKAIINALSERDETAEPQKNSKGKIEPDTDLRDYENIPLKENIDEYIKREVLPFIEPKDAEIDNDTRKIGYEIPFRKHFYVYTPLRSLEEIDKDMIENQEEISDLQEKGD